MRHGSPAPEMIASTTSGGLEGAPTILSRVVRRVQVRWGIASLVNDRAPPQEQVGVGGIGDLPDVEHPGRRRRVHAFRIAIGAKRVVRRPGRPGDPITPAVARSTPAASAAPAKASSSGHSTSRCQRSKSTSYGAWRG